MSLDRRSLVQLAGLSLVDLMTAGIPAFAQRQSRFVNKLAIPPLADGTREGEVRRYRLTAGGGTSEFFPGVKTPTLGLNGSYLGPTIRARAGDSVTIDVTNSLAEPTTLHWHGLHVPAKEDGGPHQVIAPGATWRAAFAIKQKASLCWYHSHMMERTGEQVLRGLAGMFLIEDDETSALGLPTEYGVDDIPLVVQDRRFDQDGSFQYIGAMHDVMAGYKGNVVLVNGSVSPYLELKRPRTRLRILNGSNSRIYTFGRDDGEELVVIGSDGSLLDAPQRMRRLRLAPGERAEVLFDAQPGRSVVLMSYPDEARGRMGGGMMMGPMAGNNETFPVMELRAPHGLAGKSPQLPGRLIQPTSWDPATAQRTRTFELQMGMMGGMGRGPGMMGRGMGRGGMGMGGMGMMGINGRTMDMARIDEKVPLGAVEIWEIRNASPLAHPFHIHNIMFRVLDRDGAPPLPQERGLKDTVLVDPGSSVRVITQFTDFADPVHPYMYHCHILEHEDAGMMGQFVVV